MKSALMFYPCLFCPSDVVWRSWRTHAPRCMDFSIHFIFSWITRKIL